MLESEIVEEVVEETVEDTGSEPEANDIRADIRAAIEQHAGEPSAETAEEKAERIRDEKGRFSKAQQQQITNQSPKNPVADVARTAVTAPHSWKDEYKQRFASLPPEVQQYIVQRETEAQQAISRQGRQLSEAERYRQTWEPVLRANQEHFDRWGINPEAAIPQFINAQIALDSNPAEALQLIGQSYGLKVTVEQGDPSFAQLPGYLSPIVQELNALKAERQREREERDNSRRSAVLSEIQNFASEADENGNLLRPYLRDVIDDMYVNVAYLRQQKPEAPGVEILREAYDRALWANPQTRQKSLEAERQRQTDKERAERSRLAGMAPKSSPGAGSLTPQVPNSIRETIQLAAAQHGLL